MSLDITQAMTLLLLSRLKLSENLALHLIIYITKDYE